MWRALGLILTCCVLTACASNEQLAQQQAAAEQASQAQHEARCASFGYRPNTPDYSRCLETLYMQERQDAAAQQAQRAAALDNFGTRLQKAGKALEDIDRPHTTCNFAGDTMTCY